MAERVAFEAQVQAATMDHPLAEIIGPRLGRKFWRVVSAEDYELLQMCEPFGARKVSSVAQERGIARTTLWRRLRRARLKLELACPIEPRQ